MRALPPLVAVVGTGALMLAAALAPAGCAGGAGGRTGSDRASATSLGAGSGSKGAGTVEPRAWTTSVCRALVPWRHRINDLNAQAAQQMSSATTPVQTRDNLVKLLSGAAEASEDARAKVSAAGVPAVDGGDRVASGFVAALAGVRDAYGGALKTVQGLSVTSAGTFYDQVAAAVDALNKQYAKAGLDTRSVASDVLRKDFDEVPECNSG